MMSKRCEEEAKANLVMLNLKSPLLVIEIEKGGNTPLYAHALVHITVATPSSEHGEGSCQGVMQA